jgi:hypothetical protein
MKICQKRLCLSCGYGLLKIPWHPLGKISNRFGRIFLQCYQILEGIDTHQVAGMDQARVHICETLMSAYRIEFELFSVSISYPPYDLKDNGI